MDWRQVRTLGTAVAIGFAVAGAAAAAGIPLRGTVSATDGGALEEGRVRLRAYPSDRDLAFARLGARETAPGQPVSGAAAEAELKADGRFEIEVPRAGMWRLEIEARDCLPMRFDLLPLVEETTLPAVELRRRESVEVRVLGPGGEPVAGVWVDALPTQRDFWSGGRFRRPLAGAWPLDRQAATDEQGRATLFRAAGEELTLRAGAPGFVDSDKVESRAAAVTLRLAAGRPLVVRAVDTRRAPLAGVVAQVGEGGWPALADDDGLLTLTVAASEKLSLRLGDVEGRRYAGSIAPPARPSPDPLEVELEEPRRLSGRVIDGDSRQPVAEALVWSEEPTAADTSSGDGAFAVRVRSGGRTDLFAARAGYQRLWLQVAAEASFDPVLALRPAARVRGLVVDGDGEPIEGADIWVREDQGSGVRMVFRADLLGTRSGRSDAGGRFLITGLEPGTAYKVTARRDGFAPAEVEMPELKPLATVGGLRIVLDRGSRLVGRVVDTGGAPISGARVALAPAAGGGNLRMLRALRADPEPDGPEALSDVEGAFEIAHLDSRSFDLEASAAGFVTATVPGVEVSEGAATVDAGSIVLEPGVELSGRVLDAAGQPIEGAEVRAVEPGPMNRMSLRFGAQGGEVNARSAADGHFVIRDRRTGERLDVMVRRSGYSATVVSGVEVPPVEPLVVNLTPASSLAGKILDPGGDPVAQAQIQAFVDGGGATARGNVIMMAMAGFAASNEEGEFTIEDIEPGTIRLGVVASGFRQTELSNIEVPAGADVEGLEIRLLEGASVSGRVRGSSGEGVAGARVYLVERQRRPGAGGFGAFTDGGGNYFLDGLEPGPRIVAASHDEEGETSREVVIEDGDNTLDLVFEGGVEVSGRVLDTGGTPLAGATVFVNSSRRSFRRGAEERTGADGSFTLRGVRDGTYQVNAVKKGFAQPPEGTEVEVAGSPVYGLEVRLGVGAVIAGDIRGVDPARLGAVSVSAFSPPNRYTTGDVRHDGTYRVADVGPGEWRVMARAGDGSGQAEGQVTIAPGQPEALLDLEFGAGLRVTGRVLLGTEPVAGVDARLTGIDVASRVSAMTDHDGRFSIAGVEPGRHRLTIMDFSSGLQHQEEHEILTDADLLVELAVGRVSGRIVGAPSLAPVAGAVVRLDPLAERDDAARFFDRGGSTDSAGLFSIHNVSAGGYRLVAEKDGFTPGERVVQVTADRSLEGLELTLEPTEGLVLRVLLPAGGPANRVWAAILDGGGRTVVSGEYRADDSGRVRLSTVPPGDWQLLVGSPETSVSSLRVVAPGTLGDVRLAPAARLVVAIPELAGKRAMATIEALGGDGQPAPVFSWGGRVERQWRTGSGRATLDGLPPGTWLIRATALDGRVWEDQVTLEPGANPELRLD